ncbi:MAG: PilZ domain-containing protein [Deltaproteobacteria bacterium]|nr:PilZ domain-containing protein [Deltaproteobacteria bacterium]
MVANPSRLPGREMRQHPRVDVDMPAMFGNATGYTTGEVKNISLGGLFLRGRGMSLKSGDMVTVILPLPGEELPRFLQSEVVWAQKHTVQADDAQGVGMKFTGLRPDDEIALGRLIDSLLMASGQAE